MPHLTALNPLRACVAIDDWDAVLRAVQEAFTLDARDRPSAMPTSVDASGLAALVWAQVLDPGKLEAQGSSHE